MSLIGQATFLVSFPVAASAIGAGIAAVRPPGPRVVSAIQHFAAGVVISALAGEVLPICAAKDISAGRQRGSCAGQHWCWVWQRTDDE